MSVMSALLEVWSGSREAMDNFLSVCWEVRRKEEQMNVTSSVGEFEDEKEK